MSYVNKFEPGKFFFLSEAGDGAGIAVKVANEGNEVGVQIHDDEAQHRCNGLVDKIHDWTFTPDSETTIVSDCTGNGALCDLVHSYGAPVVGGSAIMDRLEMDRGFATDIAREYKLKVPLTKDFNDWEQAKEFVEVSEKKLVFKPSKEFSGNLPSFVANDNKELIKLFDRFATRISGEPEFVLQEFVEGQDISTEAWFNGKDFVRPFNHTLETKHYANENLGKSGGCTGNVVWACDVSNPADCPLCKATILKMESFLRESSYVGPLDINSVIDENGDVWWLEFTPRMGYDASPTLFYELFDGSVGDFLSQVARGFTAEMPVKLNGFAAGVRISIPPWPNEKHVAESNIPIEGLRGEAKNHFYPYDVMLDENGELVSCGAYGIIGVCGGFAATIEEAFKEAYRIADKLRIPDKHYRTDLAELISKNYRKVERLLSLTSVVA